MDPHKMCYLKLLKPQVVSAQRPKDVSFLMVMIKDSPSDCKIGRKINLLNAWKHVTAPSR